MPIEKALVETGTKPAFSLGECIRTSVEWVVTADAEYPYQSKVGAALWSVRINDFPAESLYTLFVNGTPIGEVEDWPEPWTRPNPY